MVCSTCHALSPDALSPDALSPRALSPSALISNGLRNTWKINHYRCIFFGNMSIIVFLTKYIKEIGHSS